ncbi:class I SAM-dependent methyltransferase [Metaplanococcus flavidus]|uniref:Class I SAM-dependent methyltransferase n=1 Tax=Metaplanococcus flavidus TaxID=569883 RepID=A0ABW3LFG6_9BACL
MNEQSGINKKAWEYRAYEFWNRRDGSPHDKAQEILKDPKASLKKHQEYFDEIAGFKVANICGSNGRKAVPLSLLGADVIVFDISEENRKYALELADCANTVIDYIIGDVYDIDVNKYKNYFDVLYLEGGILHYFNDIDKLMVVLFSILKKDGRMILSDYHPLKRCITPDSKYLQNYFDQGLHNESIAYKQFFHEGEQQDFPDVSLRFYTISEIINAVVSSGFNLRRFDEHHGWNDENIPWEFTLLVIK